MKSIIYLFFFLILTGCTQAPHSPGEGVWIATPPAGNEFVHINKTGNTVIPNGRYIAPVGKSIITAPHPYGLCLSPDGNVAVTANSGTNPLSITIVRNILSDTPEVQQVPPGPSTDKGVLASVFMGLAISPDNQTVYVAGGQENKIFLFDVASGEKTGEIDCSSVSGQADYSHGYIGDLQLSEDGKTLYAVDQIGFRMIIVNIDKKVLTHSVPVGRYPFGICLSPDEKKVYVANVGMFEYGLIKDGEGEKVKPIDYPPLCFWEQGNGRGHTA